MAEIFKFESDMLNKTALKDIQAEVSIALTEFGKKLKEIMDKNKDWPLETNQTITSGLRVFVNSITPNPVELCVEMAYLSIHNKTKIVKDRKVAEGIAIQGMKDEQ